MNTPSEFLDAMRAAGLEPPHAITPGKFHRFPGIGKSKANRAAWCKLFPDGIGGCFGDYSTDLWQTWQANRDKPFTPIELDTFRRQAAEAKAHTDAERKAKQDEAAKEAAAVWQAAPAAPDDHPYLVRKRIKAHGARLDGGRLMIPARDADGELHSLQYIDAKGDKLFLAGGAKKGHHCLLGQPVDVLLMCEGYATGATLYEATGQPVAVAFDAGNLEPVATALRKKFPNLALILCADDDETGLKNAKAAAQAVGGRVAIPDFGATRPEGATDFNDMAVHCGPETVKAVIGTTLATSLGLDDHLVALDEMGDADKPLPHVVDKWIPTDEVTLLAGHGGSGKSLVALILAVCVALGLPFAGLATKQASVLFYSAEDGKRVLLKRLHRICNALKIDVADLKGKLHLLDASDLDSALHQEQRAGGKIVLETPKLAELADLVRRLDAGLVVIDNASDAYDDDEIKRPRVRAFIRSLRTKIARPGRAVLLLAHVNKVSAINKKAAGTEDYSGSTAWHNSVRSRLSLTSEGDMLTVEHAKANLGPKAAPVLLEWHDGVPVQAGTQETPGAELTKKLVRQAEEARDMQDKDALVALIKRFDQRGEPVTTSATGNSTVYKLLKVEKGFPKNTGPDRLMPLLRQLQDEGRIHRRTVRTANRKWKSVFTCAPEATTAPMPRDEEQAVIAEPAGECAIET
jgi:putative DNA primase/helicase